MASTAPNNGWNAPPANPLDVPLFGHVDFLRKCSHVDRLLVALGGSDPVGAAGTWTLAFADEPDPTFCVREWVEAGWRDPLLVHVALRVCLTRAMAEACMHWLGKDLSEHYDRASIVELARAMVALTESAKPENDV
jgi:hypothetical protein